MSGLANAFASHEHNYRAAAVEATWGHLAPKENKRYHGSILFANSAYDGPVLIDSEFTGLNDSPWLHEAMLDFISDYLTGCIVKNEYGRVYRFTGYFRNYWFKGKVTQVV